MWKRSKGFTDELVLNHACSGETCTYHRIGDVYVCEKTGNVHGIASSTSHKGVFFIDLLLFINTKGFKILNLVNNVLFFLQYVMKHAGNLSWILMTSSLYALFLVAVLIGYYHLLKWSQTM